MVVPRLGKLIASFLDIDSDQQASLPLVLLQRTNFAAVQHMGLKERFAHPPGPPVKSRAILTYPYSKPWISLAFGVLVGTWAMINFRVCGLS